MNQKDLNNESIKLLAKVYKWRKPLIIVTSFAAVISIVVSFLIAPQYKATAIVFPSRTFSTSKLLIEQNVGSQEDYMDLGDEDDAEKLLQILNSSEIRDRVAEEYNLWKNWKIEKNDIYAPHYLKLKWDEMISFKRTDYVSIRIDVFDYEAGRAANIANSIVRYADSVKFRMTKEVAKQALMIVEEEYSNTIKRIKDLEDSLQVFRDLGILDYKAEMSAFSKAMAKAVAKDDKRGIANLQAKYEILRKYGTQYNDLFESLKKYHFKYPVIKQKYDEAMVNYNRQLPSKFVVDKAVPNEKKARPVRAIIVLVPTISAFLLALLYLLFSDRLIELKKKVTTLSEEELL